MFRWLRANLGLDLIYMKLGENNRRLEKIEAQLGTVVPGMGRIVAKLDPNYARHEDDKVGDSEKIGEEVILRLKGEHEARRKMEGKS